MSVCPTHCVSDYRHEGPDEQHLELCETAGGEGVALLVLIQLLWETERGALGELLVLDVNVVNN